MAVGKYLEYYSVFVCFPITPSNIVYLAKGRNTRTECLLVVNNTNCSMRVHLTPHKAYMSSNAFNHRHHRQIYSRKFSDKRTVIIDSQMMSKDFRLLGARMRNV